MQRVAIVPPSPGKAKAVNAKQGGFFVRNTSRFCKGLKGFVGREKSSNPPLHGLAGCSGDAETMLQNCWGSGCVAKAVLQVRHPGAEHGARTGRALPAPLWGPVLKTAQGPPAMLWQHSWISPVRDLCCIDTFTLGSITGVSLRPWRECQRRENTSTALAEPGVGWQHGAAHHHPSMHQDEGWAGAGGCPQFGLHGRSVQAPEQGTRSAPEALPKDRAVNCYLSNEAVSDCLG